MLLISLLLSAYISTMSPSPWGLYYKIDLKNEATSHSEYIVIQGEVITSISFIDIDRNWVIATRFSNSDSTVLFKTINHRLKIYFYQEFTCKEYLDSMEQYTINTIDQKGNVLQFINENKEVEFTTYLSDTLPNVHPKTIMNKSIHYLPVRFEYKDRISQLARHVSDEEELVNILKHNDTSGY